MPQITVNSVSFAFHRCDPKRSGPRRFELEKVRVSSVSLRQRLQTDEIIVVTDLINGLKCLNTLNPEIHRTEILTGLSRRNISPE